jgi:hypothetical protein
LPQGAHCSGKQRDPDRDEQDSEPVGRIPADRDGMSNRDRPDEQGDEAEDEAERCPKLEQRPGAPTHRRASVRGADPEKV